MHAKATDLLHRVLASRLQGVALSLRAPRAENVRPRRAHAVAAPLTAPPARPSQLLAPLCAVEMPRLRDCMHLAPDGTWQRTSGTAAAKRAQDAVRGLRAPLRAIVP